MSLVGPSIEYGDVRPPLAPKGAMYPRGIERAEQAGLAYAFKARCLALLIVGIAVLFLSPWPRNLYYSAFVVALFLSGWLPFQLRRYRWAEQIKLVCVMLDVLLITAAVLNLPSVGALVDWPVQTRLRSQNFLLLLLLLGEAALTYSTRRMLWTGGVIAAAWSTVFLVIYGLPDSKGFADMAIQRSDEALLGVYLEATYVSLPAGLTQLIATVILTILLAIAVHRSRQHLVAQVRADVLRLDLSRYVSPDVAEALADGSVSGFGQPAVRQVAVLFADIVGFTAASEQLSPQQTFALLRSFQQRCARVVFLEKGTLDKFLGDGLMATFGALRDEPDAAGRAIACAFELQAEIDRWNSKRARRGLPALRIAIGVHHGPVVVGNMGGERRAEFTAVGDVVNVASRLEHVTRERGCSIAVSEACVRAAGNVPILSRLERPAEISVRGRRGRLKVHFGCCHGAQALTA